jgi:HlyD family secretion protein
VRCWWWTLALALAVGSCSPPLESEADASATDGTARAAAAGGPACLGRIEPASRVRKLSAPYTMLGPPILGELYADTGDRVEAAAIVARLASSTVLEAAAREADGAAEVARRRLAVIASGEKAGTIEAQRAEVLRLEAELRNAETELARRRALHRDQVLSASELDAFALVHDQRVALLDAGRDLLDAVAEVRDVDLELARAELERAIAAAERARADHEQTLVRAPVAGEVLEVNARPGEVVGPDGILELGDLSRMIVIAELYATDRGLVHVGQTAEITADFLPEPVRGTVGKIGSSIVANSTLDRDPSSFADRRVVEVEIEVDDDAALARLVHGEVRVRFEP